MASKLREYFHRDRKLLAILPRCASDVLKAWFEKINKSEKFTPGIITVIHTFGRDLKWKKYTMEKNSLANINKLKSYSKNSKYLKVKKYATQALDDYNERMNQYN